MGYGIKAPGYWGGKKNLTWKQQEGIPHPELDRAFGIWESLLGITFTRSCAANAPVDFVFKNGTSVSQFNAKLAEKVLMLKGKETLGDTLHEIGHLLGMSHEQDRPDRRADWYKEYPGVMGTAAELQGATIRESANSLQVYGDYDPESIMQYPMSKYRDKTQPSDGDVTTVKQINGW